ncbi:hypothetical protein [Streptomyces sp. NPDC002851]
MSPSTRRGRRNRPVFIERSGLRRKLLRYLAVTLGCACAGYLVFLGVIVGALKDPGRQLPPRMDEPLPTGNARHEYGWRGERPGGSGGDADGPGKSGGSGTSGGRGTADGPAASNAPDAPDAPDGPDGPDRRRGTPMRGGPGNDPGSEDTTPGAPR